MIRRLPAILLIGIALYYAIWGGEYSAFDMLDLRQRQTAETARLEETRQRVDSLETAVRMLESDPATIETLARERFGMIRDGETLYRFVELPSSPPADSANAADSLP
jgi:cell division protein FtsB